MEETITKVIAAIKHKRQLHHVVVNAAKIVHMQKNHKLFEAVKNCDLINADGQSIIWASRILNAPIKERVAGIDLMQNLVHLAKEHKYKIFFLGAKEEIVKAVVMKYQKQYSKQIIAGYRNGYFKESEELEVAKMVANSEPHILFVGMSSPRKEIFLNQFKSEFSNINFIMGVGGSFDVVAGKIRRAPKWMQKMGMEWFYRFSQEPRRLWKRYLMTNAQFIWMVINARFNL